MQKRINIGHAKRKNNSHLLNSDAGSNNLRPHTLVFLRQVAIGGQLISIFFAHFVLDLDFAFILCLGLIALSGFINLATNQIFNTARGLSERDATAFLLFDILQLAALLYLTGGLHNPFSMLMLAPITISATALSVRATIFLGAVSVCLLTALLYWYSPLYLETGQQLLQTDTFLFGFWIALLVGIIVGAIYAGRVSSERAKLSLALQATQVALAREQKLTDLSAVVAAAAHELGTPLATIKLVSAELHRDLEPGDMREDITLIQDQAERCREILRSMGRSGKDDRQIHNIPLPALLHEAAEPHVAKNDDIIFKLTQTGSLKANDIIIRRRPEIIHGLRNLIQNAFEFTAQHVWVNIDCSEQEIAVKIMDDGPGYNHSVLGRIGEPFLKSTNNARRQRYNYEGMGMGLFIAMTLLERTGAVVEFMNSEMPKLGAVITVHWSTNELRVSEGELAAPLGQNTLIDVSS